MARITIEDCLEKVPNRFKLALLAANRVKSLINGAQPVLDNSRKEKNIVLSLREIASGQLNLAELENSVGRNLVYGHGLGYEDDIFITDGEEKNDNFGHTPDSFVPVADNTKKSVKKIAIEEEKLEFDSEIAEEDFEDKETIEQGFENDEDFLSDEELEDSIEEQSEDEDEDEDEDEENEDEDE